jgi:spermidine synthase
LRTNKGILFRYLVLYTISGFVVVALETVWIRTLSLIIGNTVSAATAAICVFFVFAAIGNLLGGKIAKQTKQTALWYGSAEILFAVTALLLYPCSSFLPLANSITGFSALLNYISSAIILVAIPSLFAGISLPLLLQTFVWRSDARTGTGGLLYAGNLLGAATGVIAGGILLPMAYGYRSTIIIISILGILEGLLAILWRKHTINDDPDKSEISNKKPKKVATETSPEISAAGGYIILVASGCLGLGIELLILQYFRQFAIGSIYSVSAVLFTFLIGISAGSLCASLVSKTRFNSHQLLTFFLWASGLMCIVYTYVFHSILQNAVHHGGLIGSHDITLMKFASLTILKTTLIMLPLLICTGTIFPLAWEITEKRAVSQGSFFGKAVFVNKIGSALGAVLIPFAITPFLGLNPTLISIGFGFILIVVFLDIKFFAEMKKQISAIIIRLLAIFILILLCINIKSDLILSHSEKLLCSYNGAGSTTAVIEDDKNSRHIVLNHQYILNGTQHALTSQQNESWIPLMLTDHPGHVAFIGVASGISATAALDYPIAKLDAVEIIPDVVKAARTWFAPWNKALFEDKRSSVIIEDGRRVIAAATEKYDCVICDLVLPAGDATNDLYSKDFLTIVKNKLNNNGIFCLWLPMYQLNEEMAGIVLKTFASVYPCAIAVRGNLDPLQNILGLIGSSSPIDLSSETLQKRIASIPDSSVIRKSVFMRSEANFRLTLVGDLKAMQNNLSDSPITTDNNPVFAFRGPRPIPNGQILRALTYLKWASRIFSIKNFPSCNLGTTKADEIQAGLRAGNYYFAASVINLSIPVSPEAQIKRYKQTLEYLNTAKTLSPLSEVELNQD